ncbi:MAG: pseudouridine synthase, partial [Brevundimonas sp.]|nr:pseudouridine synthase [Brevundimonas sp.]
EAEADRPKRTFKPRADQFIDKPRDAGRSFGGKPAADGDRPKRPFKPREGSPTRSDGPSTAFKRGGGTRSNPPGGARPGGSRPGAGPAGGRGSPRGPRKP